jgi:hypothetical protein
MFFYPETCRVPPDAGKRLAWGGRQALRSEDRKTKESQCAFVFC